MKSDGLRDYEDHTTDDGTGTVGSDTLAASGKILKKLERLDRVSCRFGNLYRRLFYEDVVERELDLVDLDADTTVLQVGCGPLPMTAIALAERGYDVVAVDNDPDAVAAARRAVRNRQLDGEIDLLVSDGRTIDTGQFDVVWMAFHVCPKRKLVTETVSDLRAGQTLVYRRPRGWARSLFPDGEPPDDVSYETAEQRFGKESVVVCTDPTDCVACNDALDCPASESPEEMEQPAAEQSSTGQAGTAQPPTEQVSTGQESTTAADGGAVARESRCGDPGPQCVETQSRPSRPGPTLESLEDGERAVVCDVPEHDLLSPLGVRPGNAVRVRGRQLFGGPLIVEADGRRVAIDRQLAGRIEVEHAEAEGTSNPSLDGPS